MMPYPLFAPTLQWWPSAGFSHKVMLGMMCLLLLNGADLWAQGPLPHSPLAPPSPTPTSDELPPAQIEDPSGKQKKEQSYEHYHRAEIDITSRRLVSGDHTEYVIAMRLEPDGTVAILDEFGGHSSPDVGGGDETKITVDEKNTWSIEGNKLRIKLYRKEEQRFQNNYESGHLVWLKSSTVELPYLDETEAKKESRPSAGGWFSLGKPQRETTGTIQKQQGDMQTQCDVVCKHSHEPGYEYHSNGGWKIQVEVTFKEGSDDDENADEAETEEVPPVMVPPVTVTGETHTITQRDPEASERFNEAVAEVIQDLMEKYPDASALTLANALDEIRNARGDADPVLVAAQHYFFGLIFSGVAGFLPELVSWEAVWAWELIEASLAGPVLGAGPRDDGVFDYTVDIANWGIAGLMNRPPSPETLRGQRGFFELLAAPFYHVFESNSPLSTNNPAPPHETAIQQLFEEQVFTFPDTIFSNLHDGTQQAEIPSTHFDGLHRQPIDLLLQQLEVPSTQPPKIESLDLNAILQTSAFPTLQSPGWESLELVIEAQSNLTPPVQTELGRLLDRQDLESLLRNALKPNGQGLTPRPEIPAVKPANLQLQPGDRFQPRLPTLLPPMQKQD
jgi:hypothetical protein